VALYHIEGLYDMVGLGTWNGQPVSDSNQPSPSIRRLAADVSFYRDSENARGLWITVTGIVTTQGANWSGPPSRDIQLTGIGIDFSAGSGPSFATNLDGGFALDGQRILTSSGSTPADSTPGYALSTSGSTSWIRCASGTDFAMTNFSWVSGYTVLTGSAVFQVAVDQPISAIDWQGTSLRGRFGLDHQFIEAELVPGPSGAVLLLSVVGQGRRRRSGGFSS
jgi:hypothetical protein